jgi:hypothetical protein
VFWFKNKKFEFEIHVYLIANVCSAVLKLGILVCLCLQFELSKLCITVEVLDQI